MWVYRNKKNSLDIFQSPHRISCHKSPSTPPTPRLLSSLARRLSFIRDSLSLSPRRWCRRRVLPLSFPRMFMRHCNSVKTLSLSAHTRKDGKGKVGYVCVCGGRYVLLCVCVCRCCVTLLTASWQTGEVRELPAGVDALKKEERESAYLACLICSASLPTLLRTTLVLKKNVHIKQPCMVDPTLYSI